MPQQFFNWGARAGASGEKCPDRPRALEKVKRSQAFPSVRNRWFSFLDELTGSRYSKA